MWFVLSAIACAPQAASPAPAPAAPAASGETVDIAPVELDAGAPMQTRPSDAGPQDAAGPEANAETGQARSSEVGVVSNEPAPHAWCGNGKCAKAPLPRKPRFVARSALLVPSSHGQELRLFAARVSCAAGSGRYLRVRIDWKRGARTALDNLLYVKGQLLHYTVDVEVLRAPSGRDSAGEIRLIHSPGDNVFGGRVLVHVCTGGAP